MVDISSGDKKINITVSTSGNKASINATPDTAMYYSNKSREWAISDRIVDNTDYSSKYYANESKKQADISTAKTTEVITSGNTAVSNIESARDNAITDIINRENVSVENVNTAGATQVSSVNKAGSTQVANVNSAGTTQINLAKEQVTLATNQANIAKNQATIATNKTSEVVASGNEALSNIDTAKNNAITAITTQETTSKNNVIATGNEQVERVNLTGVDNRTPIFSKSEIGTNEGVYQNVYDLKHSTFDLSKFTVVGSPTITEDGVASGIDASNFFRFNNPVQFGVGASIFLNFITGSTLNTDSIIRFVNGVNSKYTGRMWLDNSNILTVELSKDDSNSGTFSITTTLKVEPLTTYNIVLENSAEGLKIYHLGNLIGSSNTYSTVSSLQTGFASTSLVTYDLKQFSITVDGKEVFSGNKTGLDVIKPDNYTVAGSPVISDDGIASGFSESNYLRGATGITLGDNFKIQAKFTTGDDVTSYQGILRMQSTTGFLCSISNRTSSSRLVFGIKSDISVIPVMKANTGYEILLECQNGLLTTYYSENNSNLTKVSEVENVNITLTNTFLALGNNSNLYFWQGLIDLTAFKIYVDGNLVYQPCLKIPYTQSKTGSKIVPAYARERVIDLYEQEGHAGYYTIDEANKNFTLPMGEIYGMIGQRNLISSTVTETNRVDIYSDKTCLICGNVATAGTINLPIELVNNNYFITLSTSAKTATSFTTTVTGDYILIGKVA